MDFREVRYRQTKAAGEFIEEREKLAQLRKAELLSEDLLLEKKRHPLNFFYSLTTISKDLIFFPDKDVVSRLSDFGLDKNELKWFKHYGEIYSKFSKLEDNNIEVFRFEAFLHTEVYLRLKMNRAFIDWAESNLPQINTTLLKDIFKNHFQNEKERKSKNKYLRNYTYKMRKIVEDLRSQFGDENLKKYLKNANKGNIDDTVLSALLKWGFRAKYIITVRNNKEYSKEMSKNEFLWRISEYIFYLKEDGHILTQKALIGNIRKEDNDLKRSTISRMKKLVRSFEYRFITEDEDRFTD